MRILVLGDSDSAGDHTGGSNWPDFVRDGLHATGIPDVTFDSVRFTAVPANAPAYATRKVSELAPDVVILPVSAWPFTHKLVEYRVQRLFGKRAARWYQRWEHRFDNATRKPGSSPSGVNQAARSALRRLIGTSSQMGANELADHYREVFRALARFEDTQVVAMMYPGVTRASLSPRVAAMRVRFANEMRAAAEVHRFGWVDGASVFPAGVDIRTFALDDLHFNEAGHRLIANAMLRALESPLRTASNS
ncbi:MAG: SGNH/GDSL hydrolase family protein [bacterium]